MLLAITHVTPEVGTKPLRGAVEVGQIKPTLTSSQVDIFTFDILEEDIETQHQIFVRDFPAAWSKIRQNCVHGDD
jgi:nitrous oxide reductase accessory protein NosL